MSVLVGVQAGSAISFPSLSGLLPSPAEEEISESWCESRFVAPPCRGVAPLVTVVGTGVARTSAGMR
jgi:hypothetical protein